MARLEFIDSGDRIARAHTHRRALSDLWAEYTSEDPYTPHVEVDDEGFGAIRIVQQRPMPTLMPLMLGEMLYQLRAALDACVYGAAILDSGQDPPPDAKHLEFPIFTSKREFKKATRKIRPLADKRRAIIESVQPYNAAQVGPDERFINDHLGLLHDLARRDRHRKLHVIASWINEITPMLRLPHAAEVEWTNIRPDAFLEDEAVIAEFRIVGWRPSMRSEIEANPNLLIDISLDEPSPSGRRPYQLGKMCDNLFPAVEMTIVRIKYSF